jgi:hypothetical protein
LRASAPCSPPADPAARPAGRFARRRRSVSAAAPYGGSNMIKPKTRKLSLATETVRTLRPTELAPVVGGYNSNGCGTAYSYRGQLTCNPDTLNRPIPAPIN